MKGWSRASMGRRRRREEENVEEKDDSRDAARWFNFNLPFRGAQHTHIGYVIALSCSPHFSDIYKTYQLLLYTVIYLQAQ